MKKLKQPNVYSYKCYVYPATLDIMFEMNRLDYLNANYEWSKNPEATFDYEYQNAYGYTYDFLSNKKTNENTILVVFDGIPKYPQMAHEAFHVMNGIFKYVDLEFNYRDDSGNEHLAYLIEWAMTCMCNAVEKEKKHKKNKKA